MLAQMMVALMEQEMVQNHNNGCFIIIIFIYSYTFSIIIDEIRTYSLYRNYRKTKLNHNNKHDSYHVKSHK